MCLCISEVCGLPQIIKVGIEAGTKETEHVEICMLRNLVVVRQLRSHNSSVASLDLLVCDIFIWGKDGCYEVVGKSAGFLKHPFLCAFWPKGFVINAPNINPFYEL